MSSRIAPTREVLRASAVRSYALALAVGFMAVPSMAGLRIVDQRVDVDPARGLAEFFARFDASPDLFTRDEFGRLADSFQYEIDADGPVAGESPVGSIEAVIRGDEIHVAGALRVRAAGAGVQPDPDPLAGGWGRVRATVPFDLDGPALSFEVPLNALGDTDGHFAYRLFTVEFGMMVDQVEAVAGIPNPTAVPLPPALWPACATAAGLGLVVLLRRRRLAAGGTGQLTPHAAPSQD